MSDFIQSSLAQSEARYTAWLASTRQQGKAIWQTASLPTRKTENWKYTNLSFLNKHAFFAQSPIASTIDKQAAEALYVIPELDVYRLVFVNGSFSSELSNVGCAGGLDLEAGVELCRFKDANEAQQAYISEKLNNTIDLSQHQFSALNTSHLDDGIFLRIQKNTQLQKPVHVVWLNNDTQHEYHINSRLLCVLEIGAEATLIEHFVGATGNKQQESTFTNATTELYLADNSQLTHYRLHKEHESAVHIGGIFSELQKSARLRSFYLVFGSKTKRLDIQVNCAGEGAHPDIQGIYLPKNNEHIDIHTCIEHAVPHCSSHEVFRGIIADQARAVFNGRIHIHRDAQKTEAYLSNKNLLTSNKAEVDTKPELEIYADDVKCAHGATVAQLDKTALHYFKTRGISQSDALVMLSFGFINELIADIKHQALINYLSPSIAELFSRDPKLLRHLV